MALLLTFFFFSLLFSFLCSILEAVLLSVTPSYITAQEQKQHQEIKEESEKDKKQRLRQAVMGRDLARFKDDIDRPLSAILTLNTIAHTVGAIGVGAQASTLFGSSPIVILGQAIISWEALIAGLMTLAILVFSEVIPKTLGANNWQALVPWTVPTLKVMLIVLWPLVWLSQFITRNLKQDKDKPVLSHDDFAAMAQMGKDSGVIDEKEHQIITNLLRFRILPVEDVMTPRIVVVAADEDMSMGDFHRKHDNLPFSRIPIFQGKSDNVTGYMLKDELLLNLAKDQHKKPLKTIRRDIIVAPESASITKLLDMFIRNKEQIALVVDEFGSMAGIATLEDIIETLLGLEIVDESDSVEDMQALARKQWQQRAKRMGIKLPEESEE